MLSLTVVGQYTVKPEIDTFRLKGATTAKVVAFYHREVTMYVSFNGFSDALFEARQIGSRIKDTKSRNCIKLMKNISKALTQQSLKSDTVYLSSKDFCQQYQIINSRPGLTTIEYFLAMQIINGTCSIRNSNGHLVAYVTRRKYQMGHYIAASGGSNFYLPDAMFYFLQIEEWQS